jgi:poly(3-hydroxybutyrate) depolymerase
MDFTPFLTSIILMFTSSSSRIRTTFLWTSLPLLLFISAMSPVAHAAESVKNALVRAEGNAFQIRAFLNQAESEHGQPGARAAAFLVRNMPDKDLKSLSAAFLTRNLELALQSREAFHWTAQVPEDLFVEYVLPYAVLDETRDPWREEFLALATPLVAEATSLSEAAAWLNRDLFKKIGVHYNTGRKRPNQSARESIDLGMASCTGLSIILVNACRAVGIPARAVGTPLWANKRGNHTWVEIWDGTWHFTGADEYTPEGLNRGWFVNDAAQALHDRREHAIYASRWSQNGLHFPLVWNLPDRSVPAINVTARYAAETPSPSDQAILFLRLRESAGGSRISVPFEVRLGSGPIIARDRTRAAPADLNDMPTLVLSPGQPHVIQLTRGEEFRQIELPPMEVGSSATLEAAWNELPVVSPAWIATRNWLDLSAEERGRAVPPLNYTRTEAEDTISLLWEKLRQEEGPARRRELEQGQIEAAGRSMRLLSKTFGDPSPEGPSLWISLHGGGGTAPEVNDGQWRNQINLYRPEEGIYIAPRAPTNTWNLWHEAHIDPLFDRLIESAILGYGVDPDRIYLLGYSAGGDGVYQLAPRMADRFAAAAMMAGHPNDASPLSLRNLPFAIFMGGNDTAYNRHRVAAQWEERLASLQSQDPGGYPHQATIYEGVGHWMGGRDAEALPWMYQQRRSPWPTKVVWQQGNVPHHRFYWLALPEGAARRDQSITATVHGQNIRIEAKNVSEVILRLSDQLLDLDRPITVTHAGGTLFDGVVPRSLDAIHTSLQQRPDPRSAASALLPIQLEP